MNSTTGPGCRTLLNRLIVVRWSPCRDHLGVVVNHDAAIRDPPVDLRSYTGRGQADRVEEVGDVAASQFDFEVPSPVGRSPV